MCAQPSTLPFVEEVCAERALKVASKVASKVALQPSIEATIKEALMAKGIMVIIPLGFESRPS